MMVHRSSRYNVARIAALLLVFLAVSGQDEPAGPYGCWYVVREMTELAYGRREGVPPRQAALNTYGSLQSAAAAAESCTDAELRQEALEAAVSARTMAQEVKNQIDSYDAEQQRLSGLTGGIQGTTEFLAAQQDFLHALRQYRQGLQAAKDPAVIVHEGLGAPIEQTQTPEVVRAAEGGRAPSIANMLSKLRALRERLPAVKGAADYINGLPSTDDLSEVDAAKLAQFGTAADEYAAMLDNFEQAALRIGGLGSDPDVIYDAWAATPFAADRGIGTNWIGAEVHAIKFDFPGTVEQTIATLVRKMGREKQAAQQKLGELSETLFRFLRGTESSHSAAVAEARRIAAECDAFNIAREQGGAGYEQEPAARVGTPGPAAGGGGNPPCPPLECP